MVIKRVGNLFVSLVDTKRLLREISILRRLKIHKNIVRLYDVIEPTNNSHDYSELFYIFECCNTDLRKIMISGIPLTKLHVKFIML